MSGSMEREWSVSPIQAVTGDPSASLAEKGWLVRRMRFPVGDAVLEGELNLPEAARGLVLFASVGAGNRSGAANRHLAHAICSQGIGTLLFNLLTKEEEAIDLRTRHLRFDISLLSRRLMAATAWAREQGELKGLKTGYCGASTGGGAALAAAAELGNRIDAVVSCGGRADLAGAALGRVVSPTLLIVGGRDETVLALNQDAFEQMTCEKELKVVRGATHLFEEPGALDEVARLATNWFRRHLLP